MTHKSPTWWSDFWSVSEMWYGPSHYLERWYQRLVYPVVIICIMPGCHLRTYIDFKFQFLPCRYIKSCCETFCLSLFILQALVPFLKRSRQKVEVFGSVVKYVEGPGFSPWHLQLKDSGSRFCEKPLPEVFCHNNTRFFTVLLWMEPGHLS